MASFQLSIVVPEREVFAGTVEEATLPGSEGGLGVLTGHAGLLTALREGTLSFRSGGSTRSFKVLGGFVEVTPKSVQVLADGVEEATEA